MFEIYNYGVVGKGAARALSAPPLTIDTKPGCAKRITVTLLVFRESA